METLTPTRGHGAVHPSQGTGAGVSRRGRPGAAKLINGIVVAAKVGTGEHLEVEMGEVGDSLGVGVGRGDGREVEVGQEIGTERGRKVGNIQLMMKS